MPSENDVVEHQGRLMRDASDPEAGPMGGSDPMGGGDRTGCGDSMGGAISHGRRQFP